MHRPALGTDEAAQGRGTKPSAPGASPVLTWLLGPSAGRTGRAVHVTGHLRLWPSTRARAASTSALSSGDADTGFPRAFPDNGAGPRTGRSGPGETGGISRPQSRHEIEPRALTRCVDPQPPQRSRASDQPTVCWHCGQNRTCSPATTARRHGLAPRAGSVWRVWQRKHGILQPDGTRKGLVQPTARRAP